LAFRFRQGKCHAHIARADLMNATLRGTLMNLEIISKSPSSEPRPTPLLFVHGAWHGAWCWAEHFLD
jgi:pimeloyl-ACP methyl ester carboxylesterase